MLTACKNCAEPIPTGDAEQDCVEVAAHGSLPSLLLFVDRGRLVQGCVLVDGQHSERAIRFSPESL